MNSSSVSQLLHEAYGISARPGQKVECPFCRHRTFSVKIDDTIGKCFHPGCGWFIAADHGDGVGSRINNLLEEIFFDWHAELLGLKYATHRAAYRYLTDERKVHPQVVNDSMLGAIPVNYDLDAKFASAIKEAEEAVEKEKEARKGKRGPPAKSSRYRAEDRLAFLHEVRGKLANCVRGCAGWLCFFHTNEHHRITSIRFREPFTKKVLYFKPFKTGGVFGHGLFCPYVAKNAKQYNEFLLVVEGEFNQLQFQSLCLRYGETTQQKIGYVHACAIGGVNNADIPTIHKIARFPVICYDNDTDEAGFALVKNAQQAMSVTAFTTPNLESDLDDFIRSFGNNDAQAWKSIKKLIEERRSYPRLFEGVAAEIVEVRRYQGPGDRRRDFEINARVAAIILSDLNDRGKFYRDAYKCYFFGEAEKALVEIDPENTDFIVLLAKYGINRAESLSKYVGNALHTRAIVEGVVTKIHRLAYYDAATFTLYVSNHGDQAWRITPDAITLVDNGSDGVLFLKDSQAQPFALVESDSSASLLYDIMFAKINFAEDLLTPDEMRLVFELWFLSLFFGSIIKSRPIWVMLGEKGSGKTHSLRKVGMLLFGKDFDVTKLPEDVKDFDAAITNSPFVVIDNADTYRKWLEDRLATAATGGSVKRRLYYTTNTLVEFPVCCFLAITCRTPYFRREDVADRLLIAKVHRFEKFISETKLLRELMENRDRIMTEVIHKLQLVVRALAAGGDTDDAGSFRMADFADFATKVARFSGYADKLQLILEKLTQEQLHFPVEDDPVFNLMCEWASMPGNVNRSVTNEMLLRELTRLAEKKGLDFSHKGNLRKFAQRMRAIRSSLVEFFDVSEGSAGGHRKTYQFRPKKPDPPNLGGRNTPFTPHSRENTPSQPVEGQGLVAEGEKGE